MDPGVIFWTFLMSSLKWIQFPWDYWRSRKKSEPLPPINEPLLETSAACLAENIRRRIMSSEELVRAYIKRIQQINPIINAVVEERFEEAMDEAKSVDWYLAQNLINVEELKRTKPLLGIPVTIKESCSLTGMSYTVGSLTRLGIKAESDGAAVARLKAAGAIPLLVSNTPELCLDGSSSNFVTGTTCNPYNVHRTSGGSCGGEGALLGAACSVIGLGSDVAGSIRLPSMYNGVFGHKPTSGLVPIEGHFPYSQDENFRRFLVLGPMVRYAEDLKLTMAVLVGDDWDKHKLGETVDMSKITVYYMEEAGDSVLTFPTQKEIKRAVRDAVSYLRENCQCTVSDRKFEELSRSFEMSVATFFRMKGLPDILNSSESSHILLELLKSTVGLSNFCQNTLIFYMLLRSRFAVSRSKYKKYQRELEEFRQKLINVLGTSGVFIYPPFCTTAFVHGTGISKATGLKYGMIFNILGFPSTTVPIGFDDDGLPVGVQVVAGPYQDHLCIAVAEQLEKGFGGWKKP